MDRKRKIVIGSDIGIKIQNSADISETLAAAVGSAGLVLSEDNLKPEFFDLRTGLAGEFFQKFTNYKLRVAIIVPNL
ncbi:MAG TPA: DUF4180 domain-containing protein, partial [Blastocatellia bacterium]|nr:DUF4180 domain-containing protein [Blastocatellia bacterium]